MTSTSFDVVYLPPLEGKKFFTQTGFDYGVVSDKQRKKLQGRK